MLFFTAYLYIKGKGERIIIKVKAGKVSKKKKKKGRRQTRCPDRDHAQ
jgi:hypothetical protein